MRKYIGTTKCENYRSVRSYYGKTDKRNSCCLGKATYLGWFLERERRIFQAGKIRQ